MCRSAHVLVALPIAAVIEVMRPLVVAPLRGVPPGVSGVAIVRGEVVPVLHAGQLLGDAAGPPGRFVSLRVGARRAILAVDEVLGVGLLAGDGLRGRPSLLAGPGSELVTALGRYDRELLVVLDSVRIVPESVWPLLDAARGTP